MFERLSVYAPQMRSVLRIVVALLFIAHGTQKMFGFPAAMSMGGGGGSGPAFDLFSMMGVAAVIEIVGGLMVLVGFFTRPAAFIMSGEMAVAYWLMHVGMGGLFPVSNGGDAAVMFCFVFLYLVFAGPGPWAVNQK